MKMLFTNVLKQILTGLFLVCCCIPVISQNLIDINAQGAKNLQAQESENPAVRAMFQNVERYRLFDYNKQLITLTSNNIGDTLRVVQMRKHSVYHKQHGILLQEEHLP
ncbi:MAG: hypothetical protein FWD09_07095 [Lentimicrobiaceae bacterium]|nr:hypothetical protein [Lentimicrobiaceae bacterium]